MQNSEPSFGRYQRRPCCYHIQGSEKQASNEVSKIKIVLQELRGMLLRADAFHYFSVMKAPALASLPRSLCLHSGSGCRVLWTELQVAAV